jgi:hypothetical protein
VIRRALVIAAAALTIGAAVPAHADTVGVGGKCSDHTKVGVACQESGCVPDYPCDIVICAVWLGNRCGL